MASYPFFFFGRRARSIAFSHCWSCAWWYSWLFPDPLQRMTVCLALALWAWSCGLLLWQNGLAWALVSLCPLLLQVERTLTILVPSSLWTSTGFLPVRPGPHVELPCLGGAVKFPICSMQSSLASIFGVFNVGVSPALFLPFSLLCYGHFLSPLS